MKAISLLWITFILICLKKVNECASDSSGSPGSDNSTTIVPPDSDNSTTTVPPGSDNSTTTVPPDSDNSTTTVPPGTDNSTTIVPPGSDNSTTIAPSGSDNSTTIVPPGSDDSTTIVPPGSDNSTTIVPPGSDKSTTTAPSGSDNSTTIVPPAPANSTTTAPPGVVSSTSAAPPGAVSSTSTASPGAVSSTSAASPGAVSSTSAASPGAVSSTNTASPDACDQQPCKTHHAVCVNLGGGNYTCRCTYGNHYNTTFQKCVTATTFPGNVAMSEEYDEEMKNPASEKYLKIYNKIRTLFENVFSNYTDYKETILAKIRKFAESSRSRTTAQPTTVVDVINLFDENTDMNETEIERLFNIAAEGQEEFISYTNATDCDVFGCDEDTTTCNKEELVCVCNDGLSKADPGDKSCRECQNCNSESQECIYSQGLAPLCKCKPGYTESDDKCKECSFGYSGRDCKDDSTLIAVVVGVVAAVVIAALVGGTVALAIRINKNEHKQDDAHNLMDKKSKDGGENRYVPPNPASFNGIGFPRPQAVYENPNMTKVENQNYTARRHDDDDDDEDPWLQMRRYK